MLDVVLMLLTLSASGEYHISVSSAKNMQECYDKRTSVKRVFQQAKIDLREARCAASSLQFTAFTHGASSESYQYKYRVTLQDEEVFRLEYIEPSQTCDVSPSSLVHQNTMYCATSTQKPLPVSL